uniref:Putative lipocalin-3 1 n=1 Tax=Amblyomma triste TaxID=251400 RepID=A0A023GDE9_AMBTT
MNFFIVPVFSALAAAALGADPTKNDLYKALNTEQRIWTPLRSYERSTKNEKHRCIYAKKTSLQGDNYQFDQYYKHGVEKWEKHHLYGTLTESEKSAILTVKQSPEGHGIQYTLRYWDQNTHCGIVTFKIIEGEDECELHLWEDDLMRSPSKYACEWKYDEICPKAKKHMTYTQDCLTPA